MSNHHLHPRKIFWVTIFAFLISLQYAVVSYSASTFLSSIFRQENIWILYSLGGVFAILLNFSTTSLLKNISINRLVFYSLCLALLNSLLVYYNIQNTGIYVQFASFIGLSALLFTLSSIILEEFSKDAKTGSIRGRYNAFMSFGFLLAPFISSFFITNLGIKSIFALSSFFALIAIAVFYLFIAFVPRLSPHNTSFVKGATKLFRNSDLRNISFAQFGITIFYTSAVVFIPFKLESLGITLVQYLSVILPVALSPFLFMPPLLGQIEDKMKDEKEILIAAYIALILVLVIIAFCNSTSILVWTIILFLSRLAASSAEISTNSYLFKKIDVREVGIISIFSSTDFIATLLFTPILSLVLFYTDFQTLFLTVSFFLCFMLVYISKLHDTKNYQKHKEWQDIWNRSKKRAN